MQFIAYHVGSEISPKVLFNGTNDHEIVWLYNEPKNEPEMGPKMDQKTKILCPKNLRLKWIAKLNKWAQKRTKFRALKRTKFYVSKTDQILGIKNAPNSGHQKRTKLGT